MSKNNKLNIDNILDIYSDLISKYSNLQRRSSTADKQLARMLSEYAELLSKKSKMDNVEVEGDEDDTPIVINILKTKNKSK